MRQFSHGNQKGRKASGLDNEIFTTQRNDCTCVPDCAALQAAFGIEANINYGFVSV